jgi:HptB-dependent secretion and biofilm anti anti-sigma factor
MKITKLTQQDIVVLQLQGRFDFSAHREFREATKVSLAQAAVREIQVDLGKVDYVDSAALGMLLLLRENANGIGKTITLSGATGTVKQVLDIANFQKLFTCK